MTHDRDFLPKRRRTDHLPADFTSDELTPPPVDVSGFQAWIHINKEAERTRGRLSELSVASTELKTSSADFVRRLANLELAQNESSKLMASVREAIIGLQSQTLQVLSELSSMKSSVATARTNSETWQRTFVTLIFPCLALLATIYALATRK